MLERIRIPHAVWAWIFVVAAPGAALADPLTPGQAIPMNPSSSTDLAGVSIFDNLIPFEIRNASGSVIMSGSIQNRGRKSTNLGVVILAPRIRDLSSPTGTARFIRVVCSGYANVATDVGYAFPGSGNVAPNSVERSTGTGDLLDYTFSPITLAPPDSSRFLEVLTDARGIATNGTCTVYAEETPGGAVFSTSVSGVARPVAIQSGVNIVSFEHVTGNDFRLEIEAEPNERYVLHSSTDNTNWIERTSRYSKATPQFFEFSPFGGEETSQHYRIELDLD